MLMLENSNSQWRQKTFKCGNTILSDANTLWLIHQGLAQTTTRDEEGGLLVLGYWGAGDLVGQTLSKIKPYEILCLTDVEAACVPCQYWYSLSQELRCRHQDTEELLYIFRQKPLYLRVIKFLIFLAQKSGIEQADGRLIKIPLTHQELADSIGTTRVTITKIINQLEREKLIVRPERRYIILRPALMAKFD